MSIIESNQINDLSVLEQYSPPKHKADERTANVAHKNLRCILLTEMTNTSNFNDRHTGPHSTKIFDRQSPHIQHVPGFFRPAPSVNTL